MMAKKLWLNDTDRVPASLLAGFATARRDEK